MEVCEYFPQKKRNDYKWNVKACLIEMMYTMINDCVAKLQIK